MTAESPVSVDLSIDIGGRDGRLSLEPGCSELDHDTAPWRELTKQLGVFDAGDGDRRFRPETPRGRLGGWSVSWGRDHADRNAREGAVMGATGC